MPRNPLFWGTEARSQTVQNFNVIAISHYKLLPSEEVEGECGNLTDRCYVIELKRKSNPDDKEVFNVGYRVAEDLLDLTGQPYISPPFDVMRSISTTENSSGAESTSKGATSSPSFVARLTPLNREFLAAIHIVMIAWRLKKPGGLFKSCLMYLKDSPHRDTNKRYIEMFNNALSKDSKGRTLRAMLVDIESANGRIKDFEFPIMEEILGKESNIE